MSTNIDRSVLITGAGGFVASHVVLELLRKGYDVVALDNFANCGKDKHGRPVSLSRVQEFTGKRVTFGDCDLINVEQLQEFIQHHATKSLNRISSCIHFAGVKAVSESVENPLKYYRNNVVGTVNLLKALKEANVKNFIFSSSATVYGQPESLPITEEHAVGRDLTNPYGKTKYFIEEILHDLYQSDPTWSITILRYFNPVGAHPSGVIGENPNGIPNNLMPNILRAASGRMPYLKIYGRDYDTRDGTGVRDYIHVVDLAHGHIAAMENMDVDGGYKVYNLGTGRGYSVLDVVNAMEKMSGRNIPYRFEARRPGDLPVIYCDATKAKESLKWEAKIGLNDMCKDAWNYWLQNHVNYASTSNED